MGKFNEKKVPSWCKWMAVDKNGDCWAYSLKPEAGILLAPNVWWPQQYGKWKMLYRGKPPKNWKDELYQWI